MLQGFADSQRDIVDRVCASVHYTVQKVWLMPSAAVWVRTVRRFPFCQADRKCYFNMLSKKYAKYLISSSVCVPFPFLCAGKCVAHMARTISCCPFS